MNPFHDFQYRLIPAWSAALVLISSFTLTPLAEAKIYKWRDSEGDTHYSDRPPPVRRIDGPPAASDNSANRSEEISADLPYLHSMQAPAKLFPKRSTQVAPKTNRTPKRQAAKKSNAQALARQCQGYRNQIASINKQLRSGYREPKGNRLRSRRRELSDKLYRQCR